MNLTYNNIKKMIIISIFAVLVLAIVLIKVFFISKLNDVIIVEAGTKTLDVFEFIKGKNDTGTFVTDLSTINLNAPGVYEIEIKIGKKTYFSKVEVKDTIAPVGEIVNHEIWVNEKLEAKEFVNNVIDVTDVNIYFDEEPNFNVVGEQKITVVLEDTSENKTQLKALLTIKEDIEPPEIIGVQDQTTYIGETISYRRDITITDNKDKNIDLVIDSSNVNLKKVGSYKVTYSATDLAGNTIIETATINVKEKPINNITEEELNNLADKVLANILKEDMTEVEQLWEIYRWTRKHIKYTSYSDKNDWIKEAARGIQRGIGDCFTYYATSKALLTRAGFENILVLRDTDTSFHSWNLVKVGDNWYHFDTTVSRTGYHYVCFLRTDKEVLEYSEWCKEYFKFDQANYPATSLEPLQHPRNL